MSISRHAEYTFLADPSGSGIAAGIRVKLNSSGYIVAAGAADAEIGVVENSNLNAPVASLNPDGSVAASNPSKRPLRVRLWNMTGTIDVQSAGIIAKGDKLKRAANGQVAKWVAATDAVGQANATPVYGYALQDADAAGQLIEVLPAPPLSLGTVGLLTGAVSF
ncbi:MAG: hypothetical protein WCO60_18400 [Verrucomicrobiota bacterium]